MRLHFRNGSTSDGIPLYYGVLFQLLTGVETESFYSGGRKSFRFAENRLLTAAKF
jgi:hypothetical protein